MEPFEVTKFYQYLLMIYGNKINMNRVNIHDYIGIYLDYSETGVVKVLMIKYLQKVLDKFPEELRGTSVAPVADHMFQVRWEDKTEFLEEDRDKMLHNSVAQLLFMIPQSIRYIHIAVLLLTTRVKILNKDYWGEVERVLNYLKGTS